jgi:Histidine phosphatase superfamily (branch 1)
LEPEKPAEEIPYGDRLIDVVKSMECDRIGIILRHSVRDHGRRGEVANPNMDARLTPHGHSESKRFGQSLPRGFNLVVGYSPVPRCVETATGIMNGYPHVNSDSVSDIGKDDSLAVTHFFAKDRNAMESHREKVGGLPFLREWLDGSLPVGMMKSPSEVKQFVVSSVSKDLKARQAPLLRLWVGHDYGLIVLIETIFGGRFKEIKWIPYLDGIVFCLSREGLLTATWDGEIAKLNA